MSCELGQWIRTIDGTSTPSRELIGGKAWSLACMKSMGLPVPPAFVVTTAACVEFLAQGRLPRGLDVELALGITWLEKQTGRKFGGAPPLLVSVRSGAPVSMPGMMDTVLNLGMNDATAGALGAECGDERFASDTHRRFQEMYGAIVLKEHGASARAPHGAAEQLLGAVRAVFESWNSRRAKRYRHHHGIADTLGTAVTVQAMVFGNLDERSGTGVLFTRNPLTGAPEPYGEYLARAQGEDVVSGKVTPAPLHEMRKTVPNAHQELLELARRLEAEARDAQDIEFTVERGRLYLLQTRVAKRAPQAAVRIAVDMVREGVLDVDTALGRITAEQVRLLLGPRISPVVLSAAISLVCGEGASPGVGSGVVVTRSDEAETRAANGEAVILARPTTSPEDLHGMIAARAIITEQGGSTSHASVVSRALGRPCVVGCGAGKAMSLEGRVVTVEGQLGKVYDGALELEMADGGADAYLAELADWAGERTKLQVYRPCDAPAQGVADLDEIAGADDPERIGAIVTGLAGYRGVRGGAIATEAGVRAALAAGFEFIVVEPTLPPLLLAAQSSMRRRST